MEKRKIVGSFLGAVLLAGAVGGPLAAAPVDPVKARINGFRELGTAFKNVNDKLKSDTPPLFLIQISGREIQSIAGQMKNWFPAGSGPMKGVKTAAKATIWTQPKQFNAARDLFVSRANSFAAAARSDDIASIQAEAKALGQTCSGCHKEFRTQAS